MSDLPLYRTIMSKRFYEGTLPDLVTELRRRNNHVERGLQLAERLLAEMARAETGASGPGPR